MGISSTAPMAARRPVFATKAGEGGHGLRDHVVAVVVPLLLFGLERVPAGLDGPVGFDPHSPSRFHKIRRESAWNRT